MKEIRDNITKRGKEEKGSVLLLTIIILLFLLIIALPFLFRLSSEYRITEKTYKSFAALNLAEAGIERAIWEMNHGDITSWPGDSSLRTMIVSNFQAYEGKVIGDIQITVTEPESDNPVIESTGTVAYSDSLEITKTTRTVLKRSEYAPFTYAIFAEEGIVTNVDTDTDSYNSSLGDYGVDGNKGSFGHIGTNSVNDGSITLRNNSKIRGDAYSGPESDPDLVVVLYDTAEIIGDKLTLPKQNKIPSIPPPKGLDPKGPYSLTDGATDTISQDGKYDSFVLSNGAQTTIIGDVTLYIDGEFLMNSNSILEIQPTSAVKIYLGGESFEISGGARLTNSTSKPTKLLILGTDDFNGIMHWASESDFYGAIYVPRATFQYWTSYHFYGSLIVKKFINEALPDFHFDLALNVLKIIVSPYAVRSWQEKYSPQ